MDNSIGNQKTMGSTVVPDDRSMGDTATRRPDGPAGTAGRFRVGQVVLGRYRVTGELGQGGMGVVYRCFDDVAGIDVALKALPPEVAHNSGEMEEVRENFRLVERLHHPNIANLKTLELDPATGDYYLVMECVDGLDLRQWSRQRRSKGRSLSLDEVTILAYRIASALDYAHEQRVIHRDIKPGNVRVNFEGDVKVLDFGLAAQLHSSQSRVSRICRGTSGTGPYMAPEQWMGQPQGREADQYALAATVYELLGGSPPFDNPDQAVLREAVLKQKPLPLAGLPSHVNAALSRGLAKDPALRFASCGDFVTALGGGKVHAKVPRIKGRKAFLWLAAAAAATALCCGVYMSYRPSAPRRVEQVAPAAPSAAELLITAVDAAFAAEDLDKANEKIEELRSLDPVRAESLAARLLVRKERRDAKQREETAKMERQSQARETAKAKAAEAGKKAWLAMQRDLAKAAFEKALSGVRLAGESEAGKKRTLLDLHGGTAWKSVSARLEQAVIGGDLCAEIAAWKVATETLPGAEVSAVQALEQAASPASAEETPSALEKLVKRAALQQPPQYAMLLELFEARTETPDPQLQAQLVNAVSAGLTAISKGDVYVQRVKPFVTDSSGFENRLNVPCPKCGNAGALTFTCHSCRGDGRCHNTGCANGRTNRPVFNGENVIVDCVVCKGSGTCPKCQGTGKTSGTCNTCNNKGVVFSPNKAASVCTEELRSVLTGFASLREDKKRQLKAAQDELARKADAEIETKVGVYRAELLRQAEAEGEKEAAKAADSFSRNGMGPTGSFFASGSVAAGREGESLPNLGVPVSGERQRVGEVPLTVSLEVAGGDRVYRAGEKIGFVMRASHDCHLGLVCHQSDGTVVVLFPNRYHPDSRVKAGQEMRIPSADDSAFEIVVGPPYGADKVEVLACTGNSELHALLEQAGRDGKRGYGTIERGLFVSGLAKVETAEDAEKGVIRLARTNILVRTKG